MADPSDTNGLQDSGSLQAIRRLWKRGTLERVALWLWPPLVTVAAFLIFIDFAERRADRLIAPDEGSQEVQGLQLKELVRQVKTELQQADLEAIENNEAPLFELKDFELDVNVVAKGTVGGTAEIVTVGSNVQVSRERIQRVHLRWIADPQARAVAVKQARISANATDVIDADIQQ